MPKRTSSKKKLETKMTKFNESSSMNQETPTTSHNTKKNDLMDTMSGDFKDIRPMPAFVDKTMLLKMLMLDKYSGVLLTAPPRFGKSINLSMLKRFLEVLPDSQAMSENRKLFNGTKIEEERPDIMKNHCGKYPVILLDFKCSRDDVSSYKKVLEFLRDVVHEAFKQHSYLQNSDKLNRSDKMIVEEWCDPFTYKSLAAKSLEIQSGLETLAEYLVQHFKREVTVLVDEYDCVCSNSIIYIADIEEDRKLPSGREHYKAADEIQDIISICMGTISCLLKGNENVSRGVLMGISNFLPMGLGGLNNITAYEFEKRDDFSKFHGLTLEGCKELLSRNLVSMESKYEEIKQNYNGYRGEILSIGSVMHFLNDRGEREDKNYWQHSGIVAYLDERLKLPAIRDVVSKLLSSISNEIKTELIYYNDIDHFRNTLYAKNLDVYFNVNVFLNFLLERGYLTSEDDSSGIWSRSIKVKIPNLEIKSEFLQKLQLFYSGSDCNLDLDQVKECASLFDKLTCSDKENRKLLEEISVLMNAIFSTITLSFENKATLHHIIFFRIFFCSNFKCFLDVKDSRELDIMMLNCISGMGIIIELKCEKTAEEGLIQIINNKYLDAFENEKYNPDGLKINYYLLLGVNKSANNKISLCALLNCKNLKKCVYYN